MTPFAETLKTWRKARRFSQLELAGRADVSSRHLSFLETGRAKPSRTMIARLGEALDLPLAARNQMLTHAGFAARYPRRSWEDEALAPVRAALAHIMENHAPYPAFALDRDWRVVDMNGPSRQLFGVFGLSEGGSLIEIILRGEVQAMIENWPEVAHHTAQRLRTESAAQGGSPVLDAAAEALAQTPYPGAHTGPPVLSTIYRAGGMRLSLFSTIAQFGTPEDLILDDLKIEMFFPADPETEAALRAMAAGQASPD